MPSPAPPSTVTLSADADAKTWVVRTQHTTRVRAVRLGRQGDGDGGAGFPPAPPDVAADAVLRAVRARADDGWRDLPPAERRWLAARLRELEAHHAAARRRDEDAQTLVWELGGIVREQRDRIARLTAEEAAASARPRSARGAAGTTAWSAAASSVGVGSGATPPRSPPRRTARPRSPPRAATPGDGGGGRRRRRRDADAVPAAPALAGPAARLPGASAHVAAQTLHHDLLAEHESAQFWRRRCQTKDTMVQRLQAIVDEQKAMLARRGGGVGRGGGGGGGGGGGAVRRTGARSRRSSSSSSSSSSLSGPRGGGGGGRDPSRVLLDLPGGVTGNVELNLSWPPFELDDEDTDGEDDDHAGEGGQHEEDHEEALDVLDTVEEETEEDSSITSSAEGLLVRGGGGASGESADITKGGAADTKGGGGGGSEEDADDGHGGLGRSGGTLELSRSLNSDDSGILFERYLSS